MAQDKDLQGYILERLDKPVPVKGGATLKGNGRSRPTAYRPGVHVQWRAP